MARITDRLVVQRTDDLIVFVDDSTGQEVTFPVEHTLGVMTALDYLRDPGGTLEEAVARRALLLAFLA